MANRIYTASKSRAQGRPGWTISFRHPLRTDTKGKPGLKMRRGLDTTDTEKADLMVAQMNQILADSSWWNATKRSEAEKLFAPAVTSAFFNEIQAGRPDAWAVRESLIPLPTSKDDFARVLFVGTTGAGKTSLLRHIIGSDPEKDRFPSTSTAKTTISDIEVILADSKYSAAVTFFSEFWLQANIEECVASACSAVWDDYSKTKIAERLLNHRDQRFRLSYTLGSWPIEATQLNEEDWSFDEGEPDKLLDDAIDKIEKAENVAILKDYIDRIKSVSARTIELISKELDDDVLKLAGTDREAAQELFEERVSEDDDFDSLVHDIIDAVRQRFDLIAKGELKTHNSGWPATWTFESDDRVEFIEQIRWFSSNYAPQFGRLLTPLVEGIRVKGPLFPTFDSAQPKLVLMDGQGLGHTPDSSSSVTTQITRRFGDVDVILLVDSAQQPMQAAPLSVIRAVAVGGHQQKLAIAFTHFDQVKGINLPNFATKRSHVMASVANGLSNLKDVLSPSLIRTLERTVETHCFMLGALDQSSSKLPSGVKSELQRMLDFFKRSIEPPPEPAANPIYDPDGLVLALQSAARAFRRPWIAKLGLGTHESVYKEHWTRIKALNKRIAGEIGIEYSSLKPVADLVARLSEEVSRFLDNPSRWEPKTPTEEEIELALADIRQEVYARLHDLAERRLIHDHLNEWRAAYDLNGKGSTFDRAQEINNIYESGAPIASTVINAVSAEFIREMRQLVHRAIVDHGGKLEAHVVT